MKDEEIKRVVGKETYEQLSLDEQVAHNISFNEDIQKLQKMLPGGFPGIPIGVYRFKSFEEADAQIEEAVMRVALKR